MTNPTDGQAPYPLPLPPSELPGPAYFHSGTPGAAPHYGPPPGNRHEGLAVTALVLGIVAVVFATIPLLFPVTFLLGVLAITFGAIGHRPTKGKWGIGLGIVAVIGATIGLLYVANVFDDATNGYTSNSAALAPSAPSADQSFLDAVHAQGVYPGVDDATLTAAGYSVCTALAGGNSYAAVVGTAMTAGGLDAADATNITDDAISAYCPEYSGLTVGN